MNLMKVCSVNGKLQSLRPLTSYRPRKTVGLRAAQREPGPRQQRPCKDGDGCSEQPCRAAPSSQADAGQGPRRPLEHSAFSTTPPPRLTPATPRKKAFSPPRPAGGCGHGSACSCSWWSPGAPRSPSQPVRTKVNNLASYVPLAQASVGRSSPARSPSNPYLFPDSSTKLPGPMLTQLPEDEH